MTCNVKINKDMHLSDILSEYKNNLFIVNNICVKDIMGVTVKESTKDKDNFADKKEYEYIAVLSNNEAVQIKQSTYDAYLEKRAIIELLESMVKSQNVFDSFLNMIKPEIKGVIDNVIGEIKTDYDRVKHNINESYNKILVDVKDTCDSHLKDVSELVSTSCESVVKQLNSLSDNASKEVNNFSSVMESTKLESMNALKDKLETINKDVISTINDNTHEFNIIIKNKSEDLTKVLKDVKVSNDTLNKTNDNIIVNTNKVLETQKLVHSEHVKLQELTNGLQQTIDDLNYSVGLLL